MNPQLSNKYILATQHVKHRNLRKHLPPEDKLLAVAMWQDGLDTMQISVFLHCHEALLWKQLPHWRKGTFECVMNGLL